MSVSQPTAELNSQTTQDQRHLKRIKLMQQLFASTFNLSNQTQQDPSNFKSLLLNRLPVDQTLQLEVDQILNDLEQIDQQLQIYAPERPLSEINFVDLAILRLITWESMHKKTPKKVLIDEAVELAKEFGSESSPRFVNGVLGKMYEHEIKQD